MLNIKLTVQFTVYAEFTSILFKFYLKFSKTFENFLKTLKILLKIFELSSNFSQNSNILTFVIYPKCFTFLQKVKN